jgi:phage terminase Nu1 subunit (DNA packaging protein)
MQKPSYYAKLAIDPLEYAYKNKLNPYQFNAIKYITRYKDKNGVEDLEKARDYIDELIKYEKNQLTKSALSSAPLSVTEDTSKIDFTWCKF